MNSYRAISILSIIYLAVVSLFLILHGNWFSPDQFFAVAILVTLFLGRIKQFIHDWSFPTILFLSYEYLRGLVPNLTTSAHIFPMIKFDQTVFGVVPTLKLQEIFSDTSVHWYDNLAVFLYMSHFVVPMMFGFIFWLFKKEFFKDYYMSLLVLSYMAFITYIIFPAMPPWMASADGFIPPITHIMDKVFANFAVPFALPSVYRFFGANLVAAVPSLHGAYPFLILLFILKKFKMWGFLALPYVVGVWLSVVYLGEHYVFDILVGVLYATVAFVLVTKRKYIFKKVTSFKLNFLEGGETV